MTGEIGAACPSTRRPAVAAAEGTESETATVDACIMIGSFWDSAPTSAQTSHTNAPAVPTNSTPSRCPLTLSIGANDRLAAVLLQDTVVEGDDIAGHALYGEPFLHRLPQ